MFKQLNQAVLSFIAKRQGADSIMKVGSSVEGIPVTWRTNQGAIETQTINWSQIQRVLVFQSPSFVGDDFVLWVEYDNINLTLISGTEGWEEFLAGCETHLEGFLRRAQWQIHLLAQGHDVPFVELFHVK